jgi:hypothetical protein
MGIRFYCPNGHKLNVKAFQAGRQGICPYCGVSVEIPVESTRPSSKELRDQHDYPLSPGPTGSPATPGAAASALPKAEPIGSIASSERPFTSPLFTPAASGDPAAAAPQGSYLPFPSTALPQTAAAPQTPAFMTPMPPESAAPAVVSAPMAAMPYTAPQPTAPAAASSAPAAPPAPPQVAGDPLSESPGAVWYVRPASGGQFGPATAEVMRGWLAEGRVGADTLVWREGWREWQDASATFPQLKPDEAADFFSGLASGSATPATSPAGAIHSQPVPSQHHSNASSAVIIVVLVIAVLVLLAVLVMALFKPSEEKGAGTNSKAAVLFFDPHPTHAA